MHWLANSAVTHDLILLHKSEILSHIYKTCFKKILGYGYAKRYTVLYIPTVRERTLWVYTNGEMPVPS